MARIRTILSDGFQWYVLTKEEAIKAFKDGEEVYRLYEDGGEGLVFEMDDFKYHDVFGIEKGFSELPDGVDIYRYYIETEG